MLGNECAAKMSPVNKAVSKKIEICVNKRNWLDLEKIVKINLKRLDPQRTAQKQV
jgi:hypothetical protein